MAQTAKNGKAGADLTAQTHIDPRGPGLSLSAETIDRWLLPTGVLLYLISILLPIRFDVGSLVLSLNRVLLMLTILPLGINLLAGRYGRLIATDFLFLAFLFWTGVALAANNPDRLVEQVGSTGLEFLGGYILGRALVRTPGTFMAFAMALAVSVTIALPFAVYEAFTSRPIILETLQKISAIHVPKIVQIPPRMGLDRAQVTLPHPILFGLFSSTAFSLVLVGLKGQIGNTKRYLLAGIAFACVFFSLSSGALLSIVMQLGLIVWAAMFAANKNRWLILVGLFAAMYVAIDLASNRSPIRVFMSYATFSAHNAFWRGIIFDWGIINIQNNPITGLGFRPWIRPFFMKSASVDNFWLLMAMRYGLPGFLFLVSGILILLWKVGRVRLTENTTVWRLRRAWMFTMIGVCFTLSSVAIWETVFSYVFFLIGTGAWFLSYQEPEAGQVAAPEGAAEDAAGSKRRVRYRRSASVASRRAGAGAGSGAAPVTSGRAARPGSGTAGTPERSRTGARYTRFDPGKDQ
ncbi:MAG: O-antigen ligase family protein [Marinibacterium sp.]